MGLINASRRANTNLGADAEERSATPPVGDAGYPTVLSGDGEPARSFLYQVRPADVAPFFESWNDRDLFMSGLRDAITSMLQMHILGEKMQRENCLKTRAIELQSRTAAERRVAEDKATEMEAHAIAAKERARVAVQKAEELEKRAELAGKWVLHLSKAQKSGDAVRLFNQGVLPRDAASLLKSHSKSRVQLGDRSLTKYEKEGGGEELTLLRKEFVRTEQRAAADFQ